MAQDSQSEQTRRSQLRLDAEIKYLQRLRSSEDGLGRSLVGYDKHKCIHVRIPKCASQSVSTSLFGNRGGGHVELWKYKLVFDPGEFETYFKFAFVRNPWDRFVSAFHFLKQGGCDQWDREWSQKHLARFHNFRDFVREWANPENIKTWIHFRPQTEFISVHGDCSAVDFVGYFEHLERDYAFVAHRLGIASSLMQINRRSNAKEDYRKHYDDDTAAIVADVYREDIDQLKYEFVNPYHHSK